MRCLECGEPLDRLSNEHLLRCTGITVHEYAIRHQLPLELVLQPEQINVPERVEDFPRCRGVVREHARSTLQGLRWAGQLRERGEFIEVQGEIRRLDLLLWDLERMQEYGFRFRQDYVYTSDTHRVVARSCLRAPLANLRHERGWPGVEPPPDFLDSLGVYVAHVAEWHAGYLFMQFPLGDHAETVRETLARDYRIRCKVLDAADQPAGRLLRTLELRDGERLLALLRDRLHAMPGAWERFHAATPHASVTKELVFDAAHFITDHPAKCSNLHGGRYALHVEVSGRIDPVTGCVIDYGYLKRVVNRQVVERFDHHNLNYAAPELAWRSSTEMLNAHIWECLIDYLPGLTSLRLYETTQSWCDYVGPRLAEFQERGSERLLQPFAEVADAGWRQRLLTTDSGPLRAVGGD